jgi:hypothetical protein
MAKKDKEVTEKPTVTQIPLPISDSALVIDLPDGQKLVVGKMSHGTVIEVATWRGTGRPDSRTNRMMLGMSNTEIEAQVQEEEQRQATASASGWRGRVQMVQGVMVAIVAKAKNVALGLYSKLRSGRSKKEDSEKTSPPKSLPFVGKSEKTQAADDDIQAWLDKITAKSIQKKNATPAVANSGSSAKKSTAKKATPRKK